MKRHTGSLFLLLLTLMIVVVPTAAQEDDLGSRLNTITVVGSGSAQGTPDMAMLSLGVDVTDPDVTTAFMNTNAIMEDVIVALLEAGVAREDIRTTGLNIWQEVQGFGVGAPPFLAPVATPVPQDTEPQQPLYHVSNQLTITVRDIDNVADVIQAGIDAGATNLYGLSFGIEDPQALEREARIDAMNDAASRAAQYAELIGAELGDALIVTEGTGSYFPATSGFGGEPFLSGIGTVVEPGQSTVYVQIQVVYRINR